MGVDLLLTYSWVRSTYAALVNLARHGLRVAVADASRVGMCQFSRYRGESVRYPQPYLGEREFVEALVRFAKGHELRVLLPSHDETEVIARHRPMIPGHVQVPIPSSEQLALANDKARVQEVAEACGVRTATRIRYSALDELREKVEAVPDTRLVVRLRRGNSAKGTFYPRGRADTVEVVRSLIAQYRLPLERLPVVQEYVDGEGWGVSCLYWQGERIAHFTHRRLREKTESGGTSTLREHQPNALIEQMAFKLLDHLRWHGLAMVEFKCSRDGNLAWLVEVNPRLWGSLHLAVSAGVEFPYLTYLCATAGPGEAKRYHATTRTRYPWRARWYLGDCIAAIDRLRRGRVREAVRLLTPGGTDTYDDVSLRDPLAFVGEALHYAAGFIRSGSTNPAGEGMLG